MKNLIKYIGIPHVKGVRNGEGLDCWGLTVLFYKNEFGITLPEYSHINTSTDNINHCSGLLQQTSVYQNFNLINFSKDDRDFSLVEYGDIIVFNIGGVPIHTAIAINQKDMLHSQQHCGSTIERFTSASWINRLRSFHRYKS